jgi:uncharacterized protein (DUF983 family)
MPSLGVVVTPPHDSTVVASPSLPRMIRRALLLRCPRCAGRRTLIRRWFRRWDRCRSCGIRWRREEGSELGALALNIVATFAVLAIVMTIGIVWTAPEVAVGRVLVVTGIIAIAMPIAIYPLSYTVWLAVDLRVHPIDLREQADAERAVRMASSDGPESDPDPGGARGTPAP